MSWKKLLEDKSVADDVKLNVNGIEVSVGDLRSEYKAFEKQQAEFSKQQKELEQAQVTVANAWSEYLKVKDQVPAPQSAKAAAAADFNYETDPLFSPLVKQIKTLEEATKKYDALLQKQQADFNNVTAYYLNDKWSRDFDSVAEKPANATLQDTIKYAQDNKILDPLGVPDVKGALARMSEPQRLEAIKKQAAEEAVKKYRDEQAMASLGNPNSGGGWDGGQKGDKAFASLDEAIAAAKADPAVMGPLVGIQ